jgi:hypothetical protein
MLTAKASGNIFGCSGLSADRNNLTTHEQGANPFANRRPESNSENPAGLSGAFFPELCQFDDRLHRLFHVLAADPFDR